MSEIDLTRPFIAIRTDAEGDDHTPTQGEYLVNPLDEELLDVSVSTTGFFSADGEVLSADGSAVRLLILPGRTCVRFAMSTRDEYDEFVVSWALQYRLDSGARERVSFGSNKYLADAKWVADVPILGGPARVVPRQTSQ